jgi:hypothetical protein
MSGFIGYNGSAVSFIDTVYAGTIKQGNANASSIKSVGGFIGTAIKYSTVNFENVAYLGNINMPAANDKVGKLIGAFSNAFSDGQDSVMVLTVENCIAGGGESFRVSGAEHIGSRVQ